MNDNRTSQAVSDWLAETRIVDVSGVDCICEKYLRMEKAIEVTIKALEVENGELISSEELKKQLRPVIAYLEQALSFDPLSHD